MFLPLKQKRNPTPPAKLYFQLEAALQLVRENASFSLLYGGRSPLHDQLKRLQPLQQLNL